MKVKNILKRLIEYSVVIIIALIAVIFSDFTPSQRIYYFKIGVGIFLIFILVYCVYSVYTTPDFLRIINIRRKIKRDIKELKKGKKHTHLTTGNMLYIWGNLNKFEDIKDFDILLDHIQKQTKKFIKKLTDAFAQGYSKSTK